MGGVGLNRESSVSLYVQRSESLTLTVNSPIGRHRYQFEGVDLPVSDGCKAVKPLHNRRTVGVGHSVLTRCPWSFLFGRLSQTQSETVFPQSCPARLQCYLK